MNRFWLMSILILAFKGLSAQEYEYSESDIYRSPFRRFLNQFSLNVSTGYNMTKYKHDLSGYYFLQSPDNQLIVRNTGELEPTSIAYRNWFNRPAVQPIVENEISTFVPYPSIDRPVYNSTLRTGYTVYDADSIGLGFKGKGRDIPLNIGVRYNYKNFRIGGGISMAFHKVKDMHPTVNGHGIRSYEPLQRRTFFFDYYGQVGYKFYDWWDYSLAGEFEIGKNKMGGQFSGAVSNGIYYNLGLSIEKNISEYFRIFVKPSYNFRKFVTGLPEGGGSINYKYNSFNVGVGISLTFPEIPRTPLKSDGVQLKHVIVHPKTGKYTEVRGQPIWKKQNPKVGQNHRIMIKYKLFNKRKLNPY